MKQIKRKLLSLLLAGTMRFTLAPAPLALAADSTLYVASTGDDANEGSQGAPWRTATSPTTPTATAAVWLWSITATPVRRTWINVVCIRRDLTAWGVLAARWRGELGEKWSLKDGPNLKSNGFALLKS